jgi:hypothetical protein
MGLTHPIVLNADRGWSLELGSSEISTAAQIIRSALAPLRLEDPGQEIHQVPRAGKIHRVEGPQTISDCGNCVQNVGSDWRSFTGQRDAMTV